MIVDILIGKFVANVAGNPAAVTTRNTFTPNNAVNEVSIDVAAAAWRFIFCKVGAPFYRFNDADNLTILSAGIAFPYHFIRSTTELRIKIDFYANATPYTNGQLSQDGELQFPYSDAEMSLGILVPKPTIPAVVGPYSMRGIMTAGAVSMIGSPAALNGVVQYPIPFMKVMHTLSMV